MRVAGPLPDLQIAGTWYARSPQAKNAEAQVALGVLLAYRLDPPDLDGALGMA